MSNKLTQSARQSVNFFEEFIRRDEVADFIKEYRKELNLPAEGVPFKKEDESALSDPFAAFIYIPQRLRPLFPEATKESPIRVINTCVVFARQQGIESEYIQILFRLYLFFNQTVEVALEAFPERNDFLKLEHLPSEIADYDSDDPYLLKFAYEHFESMGKKYPIVLYINPEVSQRQIQDFISKNWGVIEMYREDGVKSISGFRKKSKDKQERNDFIYKNRNLPRKEIMSLLYDKYGSNLDIDYAHIAKIISLEKKRRENK